MSPELTSRMTFTVTLQEREYILVTRALAHAIGDKNVHFKLKEIGELHALNKRLLELQAIQTREKMKLIEAKQRGAEDVDVPPI